MLPLFFGFKEIREFDEEAYKSFIASIDSTLTPVQNMVSSSEAFENLIRLGKDSSLQKNFGQPIQLLYFMEDSLVSYHINCYAPGTLTGLNWNFEDRFSTYPPQSALDVSSLGVTLKDYQRIYPKLDSTAARKQTILIFWTSMFEKSSKEAIEMVQSHIKTHQKINDITLILVNTDKFYIEGFNANRTIKNQEN